MRIHNVTLCLSIVGALASSAAAGDVLVTARGTVTEVTGGTPAAPFAGVSAGDIVEISVEAVDLPDVNTPTFWQYPTDPLRGGIQIGSAFLPSWSADSGVVNLQNEVADAVTIGLPLSAPFITGVTAGLIDVTGQFLQSPDLTALVGQTLTATFPGAAVLASSANSAIIRMEITSIQFEDGDRPLIGVNSCSAENNSALVSAITYASGSAVAAQNDVALAAGALPPLAFGFFLASQTSAFTPQPGGSTGNLCLGGAIGRYVGPGQIQNSGLYGTFELPINLSQIPTPNGFVTAGAGETWHFTSWYRDVSQSGTPTSNFSDRLSIVFE